MTFFDEDGKRLLQDAVRQAEEKTSGEFVVVVRPASQTYREVDLGVGIFLALALLCVFLYHPAPFDFTYLPLELGAAFGVGVVVSLALPGLKRLLLRRSTMIGVVRRAAREAFVDRGVHRTRGRTGVLICVSWLERRAELVADIGVVPSAFQAAWDSACEVLQTAVVRRDVAAFASGVVALGAVLAKPLPRSADDIDELPNAPGDAA